MAMQFVDTPPPPSVTNERARLLARDLEKMTYEEAQAIAANAEHYRLQIGGHPGITVSDRIALHYGIKIGEAMHLVGLAKRLIDKGPFCPHCKGTGHLRPSQ